MITTEKIQLFNSFNGNIDSLARAGSGKKKKLFENNDWALIESLYQDIELINKGLADKLYIEQTLKSMEANCDSEVLKILNDKILCFKDFKRGE